VDVVGRQEQSLAELALGADRDDLAARIDELVGVVREQVEVQPVPGELLPVEVPLPGLDRDVARRELRGRQHPRVEVDGDAGQAGRKSELPGDGGVGRQAVEAVDQVARDRVGADLRVIHAVAAAHRGASVAARVPAEADTGREVRRGVGQRLEVVAQADVHGQVLMRAPAVLGEDRDEPLLEVVAVDPEVDRLRVALDVVDRELVQGSGRVRPEREGAEDRGSRLAADAARRVAGDARPEAEGVGALDPRERVGALELVAVEVGEATARR
jgi:hypothetical protein